MSLSLMNSRINFFIKIFLFWDFMYLVLAQNGNKNITIVKTSFSCEGRPSGYYADVETGCQVYHMCDGLGRQFSYSCPNTTLFQQRMLICDHWYMVNCSRSELDYSANLLIGQRDKPFVDEAAHKRTPRPDLLAQPYAPHYQQDRDSKSQRVNYVNNLIGGNFRDKNENSTEFYILPSHWSTELSTVVSSTENPTILKQKPIKIDRKDSIKTTTAPFKINIPVTVEKDSNNIKQPSRLFEPPFVTSRFTNDQLSISKQTSKDPSAVLTQTALTLKSLKDQQKHNQTIFENFIDKPFKITLLPTTTQSPTTQTKSKTLDSNIINSKEQFTTENSYRVTKFVSPTTTEKNSLRKNQNRYNFTSTISKDFPVPNNSRINFPHTNENDISQPSSNLLPPKYEQLTIDTSTSDPRTFYKIVPSKELLPPRPQVQTTASSSKQGTTLLPAKSNSTTTGNRTDSKIDKIVQESKIRDLRRIFFIPDFNFPLDPVPRPGYDSYSSYQVNPAGDVLEIKNDTLPKKGEVNPDCPICDPAILIPGTCQPCILVRR